MWISIGYHKKNPYLFQKNHQFHGSNKKTHKTHPNGLAIPTSQAWVSTERDGEVCAWSSSKASWVTRGKGPSNGKAGAEECHLASQDLAIKWSFCLGGKSIRPVFLIEKNGGKLPGVLYYSCCVTNYTKFLMGSTFKPPGRFIKESCMPPFYTVDVTLTFLKDGVSLYHFW